jgi:hypothetical protein
VVVVVEEQRELLLPMNAALGEILENRCRDQRPPIGKSGS